jgi:hypothetical protein
LPAAASAAGLSGGVNNVSDASIGPCHNIRSCGLGIFADTVRQAIRCASPHALQRLVRPRIDYSLCGAVQYASRGVPLMAIAIVT